MSLSPIAFFGLLDANNPIGSDSRTISDDQHRNILGSCKQQGPNWTGEITSTHGDLNLLSGYVASGVKPMPGQGGVTVLYAYNTDTPPAGWTVEEPDTNLRELIIGPAAGGGVIGGLEDPTNHTYDLNTTVSVSITGSTAGHSLTAAQNGPHTHDGNGLRNADGLFSRPRSGASGNNDTTFNTTSSGSGSPHSHGISSQPGTGTGTGTLQAQPRYARGILMKLNA